MRKLYSAVSTAILNGVSGVSFLGTSTKKSVLSALFCLVCLAGLQRADAQNVTVSGASTGNGSYATLSAAFTAINSATGTITVSIVGNITETSSATLTNGVATSITITPSGTRTVSGAIAAGSPLINLNGADNVTIDGLNTGGNSLTISNTTASATAGTSTIRFINDATNNTIRNSTILGSSTVSASTATEGGVISFSTAGTTGNDNNTITGNNIGPAGSNLPIKLISSLGTTTATANNNSNNTISNNNIYDHFNATAANAGIWLGAGNTDFTISGNKFYQTATRTQTTATSVQFSAIWITNTSGNNFQVINNTIGYSSSSATGTYTLVGAAGTKFIPISLNVGTTTASSVQGNTITAIAVSGAMTSTTSTAPIRLIYVAAGLVNVGDVTGNTLGSTSATGAITYTSSSTSASDVMGIYNFGSSAFVVNNNTIGGITVANSSTGASNFYGIRVNTSTLVTATISNNTVGGTVSNSIISNSTATGTIVQGIRIETPNSTVSGNIIRNLTSVGGTGTTTSASVAGIVSTSATPNNTISQNQIFSLTNTNTTAATTITGIQYTGGTGANLVERNTIHSFSAASTAAIMNGINVSGGSTTYSNNFIRLGIDAAGNSVTTACSINGISEPLGTDNFYFNTVYVGGTGVGTTASNSFAFNSSQTINTRIFRNNIFANVRSNASTGGKHYAVRVGGPAANPAGLTINNNAYYVSGTGGVFGLFNSADVSDLAAWKTAVGQDAASFTTVPNFVSPTGTSATVDLHINTAIATQIESGGAAIAGVTIDYDGVTRNATTPDVGADEFVGTSPAPTITSVTVPTATCTASEHIITATINPTSSALSGVPVLSYSYNGGAILTVNGSNTGGNNYSFTIPAAEAPANATVTWSIAATNDIGISASVAGTAYADAPTTGYTATVTATNDAVCSGSSTNLSVSLASASAIATVGNTSGTAISTTGTPYRTATTLGFQTKSQYLILASELTAAGITVGNLTSLGVNVSTASPIGAMTNFTIGLANTNATALTSTFLTPTFTQVYSIASYSPVTGVNTHTFGTGAGSASNFVWDGTSNIVISICGTLGTSGAGTTLVTSTTSGGIIATVANATSTGCSDATGSTLTNQRPQFRIGYNPVPSAVLWSNGSTTNPTTVSPTQLTAYSATATFLGCPIVSNSKSISVTALPSAPFAGDASVQCGEAIPTVAVISTTAEPTKTFVWYAAATGGTALQTDASNTYLSTINTSTDFYVSEKVGTCESFPRTVASVTVTTADVLTAAASLTSGVCLGSSINLSSSKSGTSNDYVYTWTASPQSGSGVPVGGTTGSSITVTPTATGTYTYTITGVDGEKGCQSTDEVQVSVINPAAGVTVTASASVSTVCSGKSSVLSALVIKPGTASVGAGATTSATYSNPLYSAWANNKTQILYLKSELNAAGIYGGNISALSLSLSGTLTTTARTNFTIKLAHTSSTALTTTYLTPTFSQVFLSNYVPAVGTNSFPFGTGAGSNASFNWDGNSNLVIEICWDNTPSTATTSATCSADNTAFASVISYNSTSSARASICGATQTANSTYTVRPRLTFTANVVSTPDAVLWSNGATTNPTTVNPTVSTNYTLNALFSGCSVTSNAVAVSVNQLPVAPSVGTSTPQCGTGAPTVPLNSNTGVLNPSFLWFGSLNGTDTLQDSQSNTYTGLVSSNTTFYVAEKNTFGCESSPRVAVSVTVTQPSPVTITPSKNITICLGDTVTLNVSSVAGYTYTWSADTLAGSGFSGQNLSGAQRIFAPTVAGTTKYIVTGVEAPCTITDTVTVTINPLPTISSVTPSETPLCSGDTLILAAVKTITGTAIGARTAPASGSSAFASANTGLVFNATSQFVINSVDVYPSSTGSCTFQLQNSSSTVLQTATVNITSGSLTVPFSVPLNFTVPVGTGYRLVTSTSFSLVREFSGYTPSLPLSLGTVGSITGGLLANGASTTYYYFYNWNVSEPTDATSTLNWVWYQGVTPLNTSNTTGLATLYPTNTVGTSVVKTYYVKATDANNCVATSSNVNVTVNTLPLAPTVNNVTICGSQVATLAAATDQNGYTNPRFRWYATAVSTTPLQDSSVIYYLGAISSTVTYYVAVVSPTSGCESPRTPITITYTAPPTHTLTPVTSVGSPLSFCFNAQTVNLNATINASNYDITFSELNSTVGSGLESPDFAGGTNTLSTIVSPTASGLYTYVLYATNGSCIVNDTVYVNVKELPAITTATATPTTVCSGSNVALAATSIGSAAGTATIGAGSTSTSTYTAPFYSLWSNKRMQILYTAAELTAAGIGAGNFTSLSFPTTSGTVSNKDYSLKIGTTTESNLSTAMATGNFTTVFSDVELAQNANTDNTVTFTTPFVWNGTSNIVVELCWGDNTTTATLSSTSPADVTAFASVRYTYNTTASAGSTICPTTGTTNTSSTTRPQLKFGVSNLLTDVTGLTTWVWNPGSVSGSTPTITPTNTNPGAITTNYSVIATRNGCSSTSAALPVTIYPIPASSGLTITPSSLNQCGVGVPALTASGSGTIKWYLSNVATTPVAIGTTLGSYSISTTTTFFVALSNGNCESTRKQVVVTVINPDSLAITASANNICPNAGTSTLSVAKFGSNNTFTYAWSVNNVSGSGLSGTPTSNSIAVSPTAAGAYTYKITGTQSSNGCRQEATYTLTVVAPPSITTISATPSTVCSGGNVALAATSIGIGSSTTTTTSTTTEFGGGLYRYGAGTGDFRHQLLYTASELTALGLSAGNITALTFSVSSVGSGSAENYTIGLANISSATTALTATFQTGSFTTVYTASSYTPVSGDNVHTFSTPFTWDGTSNILINICYSVSSTGGSSTLNATTPASIRNINLLATSGACSATSGATTYANRPVVKFTGPIVTDITNSLTWLWTPGNLSGATQTVAPTSATTTTRTYSLSATSAVTGCSATSSVNVTINPTPATPTIGNNTGLCGGGVPTATATSAGATRYKWYANAAGTTLLQDSTINNYAGTIPSSTTLYVAASNGSCESPKATVSVVVTNVDSVAITVSAAPYCAGSSLTLTAFNAVTNKTQSYTSYVWSANTTTGSGITSAVDNNTTNNSVLTLTPTVAGTYTYTIVATDNVLGCSKIATKVVTINAKPVISTAYATANAICSGTSDSLYATSTGFSAGIVTAGTAATTVTTYTAPFYSLWSNKRIQFLYTASELTALGIGAGNITSLGVPTTAGTLALTDVSLKIGTTTATDLASDFATGTFTTVYTTASRSQTANTDNTITFSTPFVWNGTSNIVVELCFGNSGSSATLSSTSYYDVTSNNSVRYTYNSAATAGSTICGNLGTTTASSVNRARLKFGVANKSQDITGTITWLWTPGNLSGAAQSVTPLTNTNYTVQATNAIGCVATSSTISVNVNAVPNAPIISNNNVQCGTVTPTAIATSAGATKYKWYTSPSPAYILLQDSSINTYATPIATTTTLYVAAFNGNCEGAKTPVTITVNSAPSLALTSSTGTICLSANISTAVTAGTVGNFDTYSWSASPSVGAGVIPTSTSPTFQPTVAGTYIYTLTGSGSGCSNTTTYTLTVNSNPVITTAAAGSNAICTGGSTTLAATSFGIGAGTVTVGTGTNTTAGNFGTPLRMGNTVGNQFKCQYLIQASLLTAAGLAPGNITGLSINVNASGGGTVSNLSIKLAHTNLSAFANPTYITTGFSQVLSMPTYPTTGTVPVGNNAFTFNTPFTWDGTSNIIVEMCSQLATSGTSGDLTATAVSYTATIGNNASPTGCSGLTGNATTYNTLPNFRFQGQTATNITNLITWLWSPGSLSGATQTITPGATTNYSVLATNSNGCTATSNSIAVTVNTIPPVPSISNNNDQCGAAIPTATATSVGATKFKWYSAASGGTLLQDSSLSTYATAISTTTPLWVAASNGNCESARTPLTITVNSTDPIAIAASSANVCSNIAIILTASNTATTTTRNYTYAWTVNQANGSGLATATYGGVNNSVLNVTPTIAGSYIYTVTATDGACVISTTRNININARPVITTATASTVCSGVGAALLATTSSTGTINWVWTPASGPTRTGISTTSSILTNNTTSPTTATFSLTATFPSNGCSTTQTGITATINPSPSAITPVNSSQCGAGIPIASVSGTNGTLYNWFTAQSGGTLLQSNASNTYLQSISGTQTFWVANANSFGCTSTRTSITATVVGSDAVFASISPLSTICLGDSASLNGIQSGSSNNYSTWKWTATNTTTSGIGVGGVTTSGSATTNSIFVIPTATGTYNYTITATDNSGGSPCVQTANVALVVNGLPTINTITTNVVANTICSGNTVTVSATGAASYNWLWSTNATTTGATSSSISASPTASIVPVSTVYTVTATNNATQCSASQSISVTTNPTLTAGSILGSSSVCQNGTITLTNVASGGTWSSSNASIASINATTGVVTGVGNGGNATISYSVVNQYNCGTATTKVVTVNTAPAISAIAGSSSMCYLSRTTYTNSIAGGTWTVSPSNAGSITSAGIFTPTNTAISSATIVYTVSNAQNCSASTSFGVAYPVNAAGTWTGAFNSNSNNAANWCLNAIPSSSTPLIINTVTNPPVLNSDFTAASITFDPTAVFGLGNYTLTLNGSVTGLGTFSSSGNGSLTINSGSNAIKFTSSANSVANLTINSNTILGSALNIVKALNLNAGTLNTNNQKLTLKSSSITNSAIVSPVTGTISGNVTVERYIPNGHRGFRDIAPAIANAGSMFTNWQEAGAYTSGTGIFITGEVGTSKGFNATTGIDYSANGLNPASYFDNSKSTGNWTTITSTKGTTLDPYQPYRVLVRGDRSFDMFSVLPILGTNGNTRMVNGTAIRATGRLITGNVVYSSTGVSNSVFNSSASKLNSSSTSAFSTIANPYVCPVDLTQVSATGIEGNGSSINKFYYFDPTFGSEGKYVSVIDGVSAPIQSKASTILQAGQSIFVRNNGSTTPTITFTESAKVTNTTHTAVFGTNSINRMDFTLLRKLPSDSIYSLTDGAVAVFKAGKNNGYSSNEDAVKLNNASDNISILHSNVNLSIDGRPLATANDSIVLKLGALSTKAYQLQIDGSSFTSNGLTAYLYDAYLKSTTTLSVGVNKVNFTVDNTIAASYTNRFGVIFKPTAPLSVKSIYASATLKNEVATINWNTQGEEKVATYTVEKSIDAKNFNKVGEVVIAKNSNAAIYSATDKNIAAGNTYYRIKVTNLDGTIQYSNVAQLKKATLDATYSLYPNPMIDKTLKVQLNNVVAGKYKVIIYNTLGQIINEQSIVHEGANATYKLSVAEKLASGVYKVTIHSGTNSRVVFETNLSVQ